jgi:hypothetical protein
MSKDKSTIAKLAILTVSLCAIGIALSKSHDLEEEKKAQALIDERCYREVADIVSDRPFPFLIGARDDQGAGALYLRSYFLEFGRDHLGAHDAQTAALTKGDDATANAIKNLCDYASILDENLTLSRLAEHYVRCAVTVARARCQQENPKAASTEATSAEVPKSELSNAKSNANADAKTKQFAEALLRLAQIYERHEKYQIAEKAYQESIATAGRACKLGTGSAADLDTLKVCLDAYILFLGRLGRSDDVVSLLKDRAALP